MNLDVNVCSGIAMIQKKVWQSTSSRSLETFSLGSFRVSQGGTEAPLQIGPALSMTLLH